MTELNVPKAFPGVSTGPQTTIKAGALDGGKIAEEKAIAEKEQADAIELTEGMVIYTIVGYPVFNTSTPRGTAIRFVGGKYAVRQDDQFAEEIIEWLEPFVKSGKLTKEG